MIKVLHPYGFDTLEYSWVKATIDICTLVDYSVAKKCQQPPSSLGVLVGVHGTGPTHAYGGLATHVPAPLTREVRWDHQPS
jgi:hypothetical protein